MPVKKKPSVKPKPKPSTPAAKKPPAKKAPAKKAAPKPKSIVDQFYDDLEDGKYDDHLEDMIDEIAIQFAHLDDPVDDHGGTPDVDESLLVDFRYWWIGTKAYLKREEPDVRGEALLQRIGASKLSFFATYKGEEVLAFPGINLPQRMAKKLAIWRRETDNDGLEFVPLRSVKLISPMNTDQPNEHEESDDTDDDEGDE